jgi:hypothetical protein|tara:strand:+ start:2545 stop:2781 length:237 start_codon:yes stop_codon:yes gene_type:complete
MLNIQNLRVDEIENLTDDELHEAVALLENSQPSERQAMLLDRALDEIDFRFDADDGQPDWAQEWEDFGEVYDDDPTYI